MDTNFKDLKSKADQIKDSVNDNIENQQIDDQTSDTDAMNNSENSNQGMDYDQEYDLSQSNDFGNQSDIPNNDLNNYPSDDQIENQFDNSDQNQQPYPDQDPNFNPDDPNYDPNQEQYYEYYEDQEYNWAEDPDYDPSQDPNFDSNQQEDNDEQVKSSAGLLKQSVINQARLIKPDRRGVFERVNDFMDDTHDLMEDAAISDREMTDKRVEKNKDFMKFYNNIAGNAEVGTGDIRYIEDYLLEDEFVIQTFKFYRDSIILTNLGIYKVDIKLFNSNIFDVKFYPRETIKTISFQRNNRNYQAIIRIGVECNPDPHTKLPNKPLEFKVQAGHVEDASEIVKLVKQYYLCSY